MTYRILRQTEFNHTTGSERVHISRRTPYVKKVNPPSTRTTFTWRSHFRDTVLLEGTNCAKDNTIWRWSNIAVLIPRSFYKLAKGFAFIWHQSRTEPFHPYCESTGLGNLSSLREGWMEPHIGKSCERTCFLGARWMF